MRTESYLEKTWNEKISKKDSRFKERNKKKKKGKKSSDVSRTHTAKGEGIFFSIRELLPFVEMIKIERLPRYTRGK